MRQLTWLSILGSHLAFMRALKAQGVSRDSLPWKAPGQPYVAWTAFVITAIVTFFKGESNSMFTTIQSCQTRADELDWGRLRLVHANFQLQDVHHQLLRHSLVHCIVLVRLNIPCSLAEPGLTA